MEMASPEADTYLKTCLQDLEKMSESHASVVAEWQAYFLEMQK